MFRQKVARFSRNEEGALTIFASFMVLMMLMVCGIAVDLMQNEMMRTRVQNTLDRAVLAASDLDQEQPPEVVVRDYFAKVGMADFVNEIEITPGAELPTTNYRIVRAEARTRTPSIYMAMTGVYSLPVYTSGTAEETIENSEISLVLDISGSMRNNGKIGNLRVAAKEFIDAVLEDDVADTTSLNIVPYAGQTNPGPVVFQRAGGRPFATFLPDEVTGDPVVFGEKYFDDDGNEIDVPYNTMSSCLDLQDSDFNNINLPSGGYDQTPYFMNWSIDAPTMDWGWCPQNRSSIRYAQNDAEQLKSFIDSMRLHDGTGTQYGMKYGVALLNPSSNSTFRALNNAGLVPDRFADRPASFDDDETRKFIVLMTDGQITDQYRPKEDAAWINADQADSRSPLNNRKADRLNPYGQNENVNNFYAVCNQAKDAGITVYTIAFEAPSSAVEQMKRCASSPALFYNARGVEISTVFKSIARQINQLRLTQ
ncbi:TadE/TadG family type IV pilus assembly protein [Roseobacter weihaiensis]|uniref:TadE/TadG family type IV pilus assembly protein n=1 Tax=Roseobacter weihaiensis TaxID=2763262 RepID=UPI001D09A14C|nr:TadE/TadG family type IV pilus assembly protein [Roseobacter sp. H9]